MNKYRKLTDTEIAQLTKQGCISYEWDNVNVTTSFVAHSVHNVEFSGVNFLGEFSGEIVTVAGIKKHSGIYNAHIHHCTIHDNVYIHNISNGIANYIIEKNCFLENIQLLAVDSETTFGNGTLVPVMNEQGGREVPIFIGMTAQLAYLLAFYRHRPRLVSVLLKTINSSVESLRSSIGMIGENSRIVNCETITNTTVGPYSYLHGVKRITNSTLNSSLQGPIEIGNGIIADNIIVNGNSKITDGVLIDTCFIGEGCELAKQFSAENSLFFSNFLGHHGEAYGIFAGPHTATHHKSTLLISAYMSFLNAGSGSNQSNHLYKLGPLHQGVIDRGSKTGSDSYVLWPAHIGAFTLILGRHMNHPDVSELPYSYLIEDNGDSLLIPGVNIKSVGTIRDADKWPQRDNRVHSLDIINYDLLTPYTAGKMKKGQDILSDLLENAQHNERNCRYNGVKMPRDAVEKGINYYQMGLIKYVGNILSKRLSNSQFETLDELHSILAITEEKATESWIDMAGMVIPTFAIENLIAKIEQETFTSLDSINEYIADIQNEYANWSWSWCAKQLSKYLNKPIEETTAQDILFLLENWITTTEELDDFFVEDAVKEFSPKTRISFGIDGDRIVREADFLAVRGSVETNNFIGKINNHLTKKTKIYSEVVEKVSALIEV